MAIFQTILVPTDYSEYAMEALATAARGRTLADVMLGGAAERVVRHTDCPVMIVKLPSS